MNNINNTIIEYLQKEKYSNLSYNYIDEENKLVIVGLIDNSKTAQEWFNKNIKNIYCLKEVENSKMMILSLKE